MAVDVELVRVLFQLTVKLVPVSKPRDTWLLNCVLWVSSFVSVATPVPVPEMKGLLTGVERSSIPEVRQAAEGRGANILGESRVGHQDCQ